MNILDEIEAYSPYDEQEQKDKEQILAFLKKNPDGFLRSNTLAHMSSSCWITNETMDKVLLCYHNIYQSYTWLGGHADGEQDLLKVALKEAREESGLKSVRPYDGKIFSLECLTVDGHIKRGSYVSSHLHYNVTYLLLADEKEPLHIKPDENSSLKWFPLEEVVPVSSEPWYKKWIYPKLNAKLIALRESLKNK